MPFLADIPSLGLGFCLWALMAAGIGIVLSRLILVPQELPGGGLGRQISLWRTVIGFGSIVAISFPYRRVDESADSILGNFNTSVLVAIGVAAVALAILWTTLDGPLFDRLRLEVPRIARRIILVATVGFLMLFYSIERTYEVDYREDALFWFGIFIGGIAFYFASCWYISRHWFGLGRAHPLLPPSVTAVTVCVVSGIELFSGGPEELPAKVWLTINFFGIITTFGVCAWEYVEHVASSQNLYPDRPLATVAIVVALALGASSVFVLTGAAEERLCAGARPVLHCGGGSSAQQPDEDAPVTREFVLSAPGGIDLDTTPPTQTYDAEAADLYYDNSYALGNRLHAGEASVAQWAGVDSPDKSACQSLLTRTGLSARGVAPVQGMILCIGTSGGSLARLRISEANYATVDVVATLW